MSTPHQASNGYMIRLEVLKMAREMAEQDYHSKREALLREWQSNREVYPGKEDQFVIPTFPTLPDFPSPEDIKVKASELYTFITTK
jgi:hypothetical protein